MKQRISNWKKRLERERVYNDLLTPAGIGNSVIRKKATKPFPVAVDGITNPIVCPFEFNRNFTLIAPHTTTTLTKIGNSATSSGTISHPAVGDVHGHMANFATGAVAANRAGTGNASVMWVRGATAVGLSGFLFYARVAFPDADYDESGVGTGSRIFVGLTSGTMAASVSDINPAGHLLGFQRVSEEGVGTHTNWQFIGKDGTDIEYNDTGLVFTPERTYEFYIYAKPMFTEVHYSIKEIILGSEASGSINTFLPGASDYLRSGFQLETIDAVSRNIRTGLVYTSTLK